MQVTAVTASHHQMDMRQDTAHTAAQYLMFCRNSPEDRMVGKPLVVQSTHMLDDDAIVSMVIPSTSRIIIDYCAVHEHAMCIHKSHKSYDN
jgi:hypothetical protein